MSGHTVKDGCKKTHDYLPQEFEKLVFWFKSIQFISVKDTSDFHVARNDRFISTLQHKQTAFIQHSYSHKIIWSCHYSQGQCTCDYEWKNLTLLVNETRKFQSTFMFQKTSIKSYSLKTSLQTFFCIGRTNPHL